MNVQTPEWQGYPKPFAEELFKRIFEALKVELSESPKEQHKQIIKDAAEVFYGRLMSKTFQIANTPKGRDSIDDLQSEYANRFKEMAADLK